MKPRKHVRLFLTLWVTVCAVLLVATVGVWALVQYGTVPGSGNTLATPTATPIAPLAISPSTPTPTLPLLPEGNDWTQYRFDVSGTGVNPETRISSSTIAHLRQQWAFGPYNQFLATPAIVNGVVYATSYQDLLAFDLRTGARQWISHLLPPYVLDNSSIAVNVDAHLGYLGTSSAALYAFDLTNGRVVWNVPLGDPTKGAWIWSSPLLLNGKLYIGLASRDNHPCVRGALFALDAMTGQIVWKHYTVPAGALGGGVWSSPTADPQLHQLIVTTGNPCPEGAVTGEEDSILALDWDTGVLRWQFRAIAYDFCDCDFGEGAVIYTLHGQQYIVAGSKLGMVYALIPPATPRGSPKLAWSARIAHAGFLGSGGIFQPPAYRDGLVLFAGGPTLDGACPQGALHAFWGDTGALVWRRCTASQLVSSAAITGDVIFVAMSNRLAAYQLATGQLVCQAPQVGATWGGVAISRAYVISGTLAGRLYCYSLPQPYFSPGLR